MFSKDLLEFLRAAPFERFRLCLSDGSTFEIRHPEMVKVEKTKAHVFFHEKDQPYGLVRRKLAVSRLHINRVEPITQAVGGASSNGDGTHGANS